MKNNMFSGIKEVFIFTLKQAATRKYVIFTLSFALMLLIAGFGINIYSANGQKKEANISPIERVYIIDKSDIKDVDWEDTKRLNREQFPKIVFEKADEDTKTLGLKLKDNEVKNVIVTISKEKESYNIGVYIPHGSEITKDDGNNLAKAVKDIVHEGIIEESGIDSDKITYVISGMSTEFCSVGESAKSDSMRAFSTIFPMIFMLVIYFMVIIYGQSMGQIVSIEKSSKLMESLLLMTRPYGLIFGKILATAFTAILQIVIWLVAAVTGLLVGDRVVRQVFYADYDNGILSMFSAIAMDESVKAFSSEAIILALAALCLAFLFYCMLAGAIASFASKADELGSVMMFFNMFIIIGFLGSYILPSMIGQEWVKVIIRLIPVSAAFLLPGEILAGTLRTIEGLGYSVVLLAWIVLTAIFAGKVYKDQLFYNGKGLKDRLPWDKKTVLEENEEQWDFLHDEAGRPIEKSQKIGYFFVAISPFAVFLVIQVIASFVITNVMTRVDFRGIDLSVWETKDFVNYYRGIENILNPLTMVVIHLLIITTFGIWMYCVRRGIDKNNILHIKHLFSRKIGIIAGVCLICGLALCILANGVVAIEAEVIPAVVEDYVKMAESTGMGISPFAIFAAVCLAPIGEELLCRGVCLYFGKKAFGKFWYANILQAILFGVLHMNWVQGIYAFIIGLILGVLVERYESLLPAMIVHFIVNLSSSTWVKQVLGNVELSLTAGIAMVALTGIITIAVLRMSREV